MPDTERSAAVSGCGLKPAPLYSTQAFDAFIRLSDNVIVYSPKPGIAPLEGRHRAS